MPMSIFRQSSSLLKSNDHMLYKHSVPSTVSKDPPKKHIIIYSSILTIAKRILFHDRYVNSISSILSSSIPVLGSLLSPTYFQYFLDKVRLLLIFIAAITLFVHHLLLEVHIGGQHNLLYLIDCSDAACSLSWSSVLSQYI
jgi:hypothetical protein